MFYVGEPITFTLDKAAVRYEVRDYYGTMVDQGALGGGIPQTFHPAVSIPGWYKLYVYGGNDQGEPWGTVVGGTNFVIFRNDANFPALPAVDTPGGWHSSEDQVMRGVTGMGPQRLKVDDAANPDEAIARLEQDIAIDKAMYLPFDPVRKRELLIGFPNGVGGTNSAAKIAGVKKIVERFKSDVKYWEGRNEPDQAGSAGYAAYFEQTPFYDAVKSVDPTLKVLGPGTTQPNLTEWLTNFLKIASRKFDVFSFHAYNSVNGDLWLTRQRMADLQTLLKGFGLENVEKWQTEQGYFAAVYGSYQPRLQGRWTMLQMMAYEQLGIPKEHNHLWYDKSHGFWDVPAFWENDDGSLNPAAALMRVYSEELYGTIYSRAFNFGAVSDGHMIGNLFIGPGKSVAAFMTAGDPYGRVTLAVTGSNILRVVSPLGVESVLNVTGGQITLPIGELPTYVRIAEGQTVEVVPRAYGENVARRPGVTFAVNGTADSSAATLADGIIGNSTYAGAYGQWKLTPTQWPVTVDIQLPAEERISDAIIRAAVPWQGDSTLVDYELQYLDGSTWTSLGRVTEPTKTWKVYSPPVRCTVDSFFSDRSVFEHHFPAITTSKLRLVIYSATYGGGATADVLEAGGQAGPQSITLREIEIFKSPEGSVPTAPTAPANTNPAAGSNVTLQVANDPTLQYQWLKNGQFITGANTSALTLSGIKLDDQGAYSVTVTNAYGSATTQPSYVILDTPFNRWAARFYSPEELARPRELLSANSSSGTGQAAGRAVAAPTADTDSDLTVLEKYFFGLDPRFPIQNKSGIVTIQSDRSSGAPAVWLMCQINPDATDLAWSVEATEALGSIPWESTAPAATQVGATDANTGRAPVAMMFPVGERRAQFLRLRITMP